MWMDAYVQDIMMRERMADARQRAVRYYLLREGRPERARRRPWAVVARVVRAASALWPKRRLTRATS